MNTERTRRRLLALLVAAALAVAACGDSSDSADTTTSTASPTTTSAETTTAPSPTAGGSETTVRPTLPPPTDPQGRFCDSGAFRNDEEMRFLVCDVQYLRLDVLEAGVEEDPQWLRRASQAILGYDRSPEASKDALRELKAELTALLES